MKSQSRNRVHFALESYVTHVTQYREIHLAFPGQHECCGTSSLRNISYVKVVSIAVIGMGFAASRHESARFV